MSERSQDQVLWATRFPPHVKGLPSQTRALHRAVDGLRLSGTEGAVLRVFCEMADGAGFCWPSVKTLVRESGYSERSVFRGLRKLEAAEHVVRYPSLRDPGRYGSHLPRRARHGQGPNIYHLGTRLRAAAGFRGIEVTEHLGLRPSGPQKPSVASPESRIAPPRSEAMAPLRNGTPELDPMAPPKVRGKEADSGPADGTPRTENGKPLIEEEWDQDHVEGETDDEKLIVLVGEKNGNREPGEGVMEALECARRAQPRPEIDWPDTSGLSNEEAILADTEAMVEVGAAEWIEPDEEAARLAAVSGTSGASHETATSTEEETA